jgi:hypothetical protein
MILMALISVRGHSLSKISLKFRLRAIDRSVKPSSCDPVIRDRQFRFATREMGLYERLDQAALQIVDAVQQAVK